MVLLIKGRGSISAMRDLVGPDDPELWPEEGETIRGIYGTDALRNAMSCSISDIGGRREAEFWIELLRERAQMDALLKSGQSKPAKKSHWVNMSDLLAFCFPIDDRHPHSTGRLAVFGNYGPLADDGNLSSGIQGRRIVSHMELNAMIEEMQREDILRVYIGNARLQGRPRKKFFAKQTWR